MKSTAWIRQAASKLAQSVLNPTVRYSGLAVLTAPEWRLRRNGISIYIAYRVSPGEYKGEKQDAYMLSLVKKNIPELDDTKLLSINYRLSIQAEDEINDDSVLLCGTFEHFCVDEYAREGRFIAIFSRDYSNFLNKLFSTSPKYVLNNVYYTPTAINQDNLIIDDGYLVDLDDDNVSEIDLVYESFFGDRNCNTDILIKKIKGEWRIITPDFSDIEDELKKYKDIENEYIISLDEFQMYSPVLKEEKTVYGLSRAGGIADVVNPIYGGTNYLYIIANGRLGALIDSDYNSYFLAMERLSGDHFELDPNWNGGQYLYCEPQKEIDEDLIEEKWGIQIGNSIFYGQDVD